MTVTIGSILRAVSLLILLCATTAVRADLLPQSAFEKSAFCKKREYAINLWLQSDHGSRAESKRKLNEDNYGAGLKITCDGWLFVHADKLKNSQFGYTDLVMVGITAKWYPFGSSDGFHVSGSLGEVYLNYRVPRLRANVEGHAHAGYVGIGYGPVSLQIAPVPKQKDTYITFMTLRVPF